MFEYDGETEGCARGSEVRRSERGPIARVFFSQVCVLCDQAPRGILTLRGEGGTPEQAELELRARLDEFRRATCAARARMSAARAVEEARAYLAEAELRMTEARGRYADARAVEEAERRVPEAVGWEVIQSDSRFTLVRGIVPRETEVTDPALFEMATLPDERVEVTLRLFR